MPTTLAKRHPTRPFSRLPLSDSARDLQVQRGLYTVQRGERLAIPVDRLDTPTVYLNRDLWQRDAQGRVFRPGSRMEEPRIKWVETARRWLAQHHPNLLYQLNLWTLGHDLHYSARANLYAKHWHIGWANPFDPERFDPPLSLESAHFGGYMPWMEGAQGFTEDCGWLSGALITEAFMAIEIGALADAAGTVDAAEYNDFNEHEVGTSSAAENNDDTALTTSSGIALQAGTQVDNGEVSAEVFQYETVATITADATESWEEHGVFSTTADTMMDRNLTGGQSVNSSDQVQYTYDHNHTAET